MATHLGMAEPEPAALGTPSTIQFGERLLAGAIGSASGRTVLTTALHHQGLGPEAVLDLLNRTSQAVQFNRELLESTLDNMSQGVAVVDKQLRLVGWNRRYVELMDYPENTVHLGQPIEELIRLNAGRGLIKDENHEAGIQKRLEHLRGRAPYRLERQWQDGRVIEIHGNPMPGGGYVTTFTDISHFKTIEQELQLINETLEQRVQQRTTELRQALEDVEDAREAAETANRSKTRFLAAASHDLLQPMNAARLFVSILRQQQEPEGEQARLVMRIDRSLTAAEELLTALLDISKLDSGMYQPESELIAVPELFEQLRRRFKPLAANKNLELRVHSGAYRIFSDRNLLYRIIQNFLANAIRYTEKGGVLLGCQVRGDALKISVWDTGVGIAKSEEAAIFQEFHRLEYAQRLNDKGLGLGLAICERIARMLGHRMSLRSRERSGSCFSVEVPLAGSHELDEKALPKSGGGEGSLLENLSVLCVDNEKDILDGMKMLLERWGCDVMLAEDLQQAGEQIRKHGKPGLTLVDYHLSDQSNGLDVMEHLQRLAGETLHAIVITADRSPELEEQVRDQGLGLLRKPIKPAALRALMTNTLKNL
jgi:signal transduction histidine kinase